MDDVLAVMDAVGSERASLFGYSEGGSMSSLFAATYPERTEALIICGGYARKLQTEDYEWGTSEEENEVYFEALPNVWGGPVGIETIAQSMAKDARFRQWWAKFLRNSARPVNSYRLDFNSSISSPGHTVPSTMTAP